MNRKERRRFGLPKFSAFPKTNRLFHDFGAALLPDGLKVLPQTPSFDDLRRVITLLMYPPAQPASPPLDFIVINLKWARAIVGEKNFKKLRSTKRTYTMGLADLRTSLKARG